MKCKCAVSLGNKFYKDCEYNCQYIGDYIAVVSENEYVYYFYKNEHVNSAQLKQTYVFSNYFSIAIKEIRRLKLEQINKK